MKINNTQYPHFVVSFRGRGDAGKAAEAAAVALNERYGNTGSEFASTPDGAIYSRHATREIEHEADVFCHGFLHGTWYRA